MSGQKVANGGKGGDDARACLREVLQPCDAAAHRDTDSDHLGGGSACARYEQRAGASQPPSERNSNPSGADSEYLSRYTQRPTIENNRTESGTFEQGYGHNIQAAREPGASEGRGARQQWRVGTGPEARGFSGL